MHILRHFMSLMSWQKRIAWSSANDRHWMNFMNWPITSLHGTHCELPVNAWNVCHYMSIHGFNAELGQAMRRLKWLGHAWDLCDRVNWWNFNWLGHAWNNLVTKSGIKSMREDMSFDEICEMTGYFAWVPLKNGSNMGLMSRVGHVI